MSQPVTAPPTMAQRIRAAVEPRAQTRRVQDVVVGLIYTAVRLDDGRTGVAMTLRPDDGGDCGQHFRVGTPLRGQPAAALLQRLEGGDPVEVAAGLACANALANTRALPCEPSDARRALDLRPEDRVAMVGHFRPVVDEVRRRCRELIIFERVDAATDELRPAAEAPVALPCCDVALITATAIVHGSLDGLLQAAAGCREVALLGASTPLVPAAFTGTPVTLLSGVLIDDTDAVLRVVAEAGGMRRFKPFLTKVNLRLR